MRQLRLEIKKDSHDELWVSIYRQLIPRYIRDPKTGGYGIYLVFWFDKENVKWPPSGEKPQTAKELEDRLKQTLTEEEKQYIYVCVIDCSIEK